MNEQLLQELSEKFACTSAGYHPGSDSWKLQVSVERLHDLLEFLLRDQHCWCDFLSCISAEHLTGAEEKIQLNYHLESIPNGLKFQVICSEPIGESTFNPAFPSVSDLWHTASWHEREAAELFGITFENHPDPRNLLLPADWIGFPLRKNYLAAEKYHGLNIRYERSDPGEK
jgi:NADH-quinone oxidoreductase subunit C